MASNDYWLERPKRKQPKNKTKYTITCRMYALYSSPEYPELVAGSNSLDKLRLTALKYLIKQKKDTRVRTGQYRFFAYVYGPGRNIFGEISSSTEIGTISVVDFADRAININFGDYVALVYTGETGPVVGSFVINLKTGKLEKRVEDVQRELGVPIPIIHTHF